MTFRIFSAILAALFLTACGDNVPNIEDPHRIVVDGKKLTQAEFLVQYCAGKANNETCLKVLHAKRIDSVGGEWPKF